MRKVSGSVGWDGPGRALSSPARSHLAPGSPLPLNSPGNEWTSAGAEAGKSRAWVAFEIVYPPRRNPRIAGGDGLLHVGDGRNPPANASGKAGIDGENWLRLRPHTRIPVFRKRISSRRSRPRADIRIKGAGGDDRRGINDIKSDSRRPIVQTLTDAVLPSANQTLVIPFCVDQDSTIAPTLEGQTDATVSDLVGLLRQWQDGLRQLHIAHARLAAAYERRSRWLGGSAAVIAALVARYHRRPGQKRRWLGAGGFRGDEPARRPIIGAADLSQLLTLAHSTAPRRQSSVLCAANANTCSGKGRQSPPRSQNEPRTSGKNGPRPSTRAPNLLQFTLDAVKAELDVQRPAASA